MVTICIHCHFYFRLDWDALTTIPTSMSLDTSAWCYNYTQMLILRQRKEVIMESILIIQNQLYYIINMPNNGEAVALIIKCNNKMYLDALIPSLH